MNEKKIDIPLQDESIAKDERYWGIKTRKLWDLQAKFEKITEKYPELGPKLDSMWDELTLFNIPIERNVNGIDFTLTTDTGRVVGHGKFDDKLKDVTMEEMDNYLH